MQSYSRGFNHFIFGSFFIYLKAKEILEKFLEGDQLEVPRLHEMGRFLGIHAVKLPPRRDDAPPLEGEEQLVNIFDDILGSF